LNQLNQLIQFHATCILQEDFSKYWEKMSLKSKHAMDNTLGEDETAQEVEEKQSDVGHDNDQTSINSDDKPPTNSRIYPKVCPECHYAWMAERFDDVGRHQQKTKEGFRDEDCLLWNVINNASSVDLKRTNRGTEVMRIDITGGPWEKEAKPLKARDGEDEHREATDESNESEIQIAHSSEPKKGDSEGTLLHLSGKLSAGELVGK
jgi:hypothetical protein